MLLVRKFPAFWPCFTLLSLLFDQLLPPLPFLMSMTRTGLVQSRPIAAIRNRHFYHHNQHRRRSRSSSPLTFSSTPDEIHWTPDNPLFTDNTHFASGGGEPWRSLSINLGEHLDFICPSSETSRTDPVPSLVIHMVSELSFLTCQLDSNALPVLKCDGGEGTRRRRRFWFRQNNVEGKSGGQNTNNENANNNSPMLAFVPGNAYYFTSTSDGSATGLWNSQRGFCQTQNMRVQVNFMDLGEEEETPKHKTTTENSTTIEYSIEEQPEHNSVAGTTGVNRKLSHSEAATRAVEPHALPVVFRRHRLSKPNKEEPVEEGTTSSRNQTNTGSNSLTDVFAGVIGVRPEFLELVEQAAQRGETGNIKFPPQSSSSLKNDDITTTPQQPPTDKPSLHHSTAVDLSHFGSALFSPRTAFDNNHFRQRESDAGDQRRKVEESTTLNSNNFHQMEFSVEVAGLKKEESEAVRSDSENTSSTSSSSSSRNNGITLNTLISSLFIILNLFLHCIIYAF